MGLHPSFPDSPHAILDLGVRWFPADGALRETSAEKLMPPLELKSVFHECAPGRRKIAVKVVDIFGNDTMTIVEFMVGGKK